MAAAGAKRIDVLWVGKAGTFFVMFSLPAFLGADITNGWFPDLCIVFPRGPARSPTLLVELLYAAAAYVPAAPGCAQGRPRGSNARRRFDIGPGRRQR